MVSINSKTGNAPLQQSHHPGQVQFEIQQKPYQLGTSGKAGPVLSPRSHARDNADRIQNFYEKLDKQIQQKKGKTRQVVLKKHTQGEMLGKSGVVGGPTPQPQGTSMVQYVKDIQGANNNGGSRIQNVPSSSMDYQSGKVTVQQLNSREIYAQNNKVDSASADHNKPQRGPQRKRSQHESNGAQTKNTASQPASISQMEMLQAQILQQIQSQNSTGAGNPVNVASASGSTPKEQRRRLLESMPAQNSQGTSTSLPQQPTSTQVSANYLGLLVNTKPMINESALPLSKGVSSAGAPPASTQGARQVEQAYYRFGGSCSNFQQLEVTTASTAVATAHQQQDSNQRKKRSSNEIFNGIRILNKRVAHDSNDKLLDSVVVAQRTAVTSIGGSRLSQNKARLDRQRTTTTATASNAQQLGSASNATKDHFSSNNRESQLLSNVASTATAVNGNASGQLRLATTVTNGSGSQHAKQSSAQVFNMLQSDQKRRVYTSSNRRQKPPTANGVSGAASNGGTFSADPSTAAGGMASHASVTIENDPTIDTRNLTLPSSAPTQQQLAAPTNNVIVVNGVPSKPSNEKRVNSIDNYILKLTSQGKKPNPLGAAPGGVQQPGALQNAPSLHDAKGNGMMMAASQQQTHGDGQQQTEGQQPVQVISKVSREKFKVDLNREDLPSQQKQLWQQLQLLKLLRQDYKGLGKNIKGFGGRSGAQQQITHQYGFQMTEEEMFNRIFRYTPAMKGKQNYAQLECLECLKLTNKMLGEELALLVQARHKRQGKAITIALTADGRLKSASKQQIGSEVVVGYNFTRRSKSNNGQMRGGAGGVAVGAGGIINGEMTVEQAAQLLHGSPQIFMRKQITDPYFAPIVTGTGIHGIGQNPALSGSKDLEFACVVGDDNVGLIGTGCDPSGINSKITAKGVLQGGAKDSTGANSELPGVASKQKKTRQPSKMSTDDTLMNDKSILQIYDGMSKRFKNDYPATNLTKPPITSHKHLKKSLINQTIQKVNQVILILFKTKLKPEDQQVIRLLKHFNVPVPRSNGLGLDLAEVRKPDFQQMVNIKLMQRLYRVLNAENNYAKPETNSNYFKFFVGHGNNYPCVRQIIKRRSWWHRNKREQFIGMNHESESDGSPDNDGNGGANTNQNHGAAYKLSPGAHFVWTQWRKAELHEHLKRRAKPQPTLIYAKLEDNFHLANKKALFMNISNYYRAMGLDPFEVAIPLTFHIKSQSDPEYMRFIHAYQMNARRRDSHNIWIIKPGENSNRGAGIQVADQLSEIRSIVHSIAQSTGNRTAIVQKYIEKPLLVTGRKFDIRAFAMLTSVNGCLKGYMYRDCYFRTSCKMFDLGNLNSRYVHLTNDAVQINSEDYGKFENGNKLSINDFQRFLDLNYPSRNICFMRDLFPQIERFVTDSFRAVMDKIDPRRLSHSFEVLGYDFMIDDNFKVYLIEANTNPSLEICSPLLARIIPELLDNSFRIAVDPLYQPPALLEEQRGPDLSPMPRPMLGQVANGGGGPNTSANNNERRTQGATDAVRARAGAEEEPASPPAHSAVGQPRQVGNGHHNGTQKTTFGNNSNCHGSQTQKQRKRFELMPSIKYTLVFDERVDRADLEKLNRKDTDTEAGTGAAEDDLFEEIKEEEKIGELDQQDQQRKQEKEQLQQQLSEHSHEGPAEEHEEDEAGASATRKAAVEQPEIDPASDDHLAQMDAQQQEPEDECDSDSELE